MLTKRDFLLTSALISVLPTTTQALGTGTTAGRVEPFPLEAVTLTDSRWLTALETNLAYLNTLDPDRLLHNFHVSAGLAPKAKVYGGWEAMGIAGHTLGHYLSACALAYGQTRKGVFRDRLNAIVAELAVIQDAHGDGYVGGTTVEREGRVVDGKIVFEEIRRHIITSNGFDLNGGWVPLYTWHKVHAGLLDAHRYTQNPQALTVAVRMSDYLIGVLAGLSESEMQQVLAAEHGGLNETFAETYARTGEPRFLDMARRLYHRAILEPLGQGRDELAGKHANTQIPKVIGLARLHELTGETAYADTARYFWDRVTHHHSFVIGGNSTSEQFGPADRLSTGIDDKTCEACNTYNMLKLTRHLYQAAPDAAWFDVYERAHLNHIMAHQAPDTGAFVYFMPLSSGSQRLYSTPTDSFWCCVGSGMESHAKHGDSIYWQRRDEVLVNLFIPSRLDWAEKKTRITLSGDIVTREPIRLEVEPDRPVRFTLCLRVPGWSAAPSLRINGRAEPLDLKDGYLRIQRRWKPGDRVVLDLPQSLRTESPSDNPNLVAFVRGPVVLAADMGPAGGVIPPVPVLVGSDPLSAVASTPPTLNSRPSPLPLVPFFAQHHRRSAVYFPLFTAERWSRQQAEWEAQQAAEKALAARTVDVIRLGEMQPERDHNFATDIAEVASRTGRSGRWLMWSTDKAFGFDLAVSPDTTALRLTFWGQDTYKRFDIAIDGQTLKTETLALPPVEGFRSIDYPLPAATLAGRTKVRVRLITRGSDLAVFEARTLRS
jgi:DUF1680 family protein